MSVFTTVTPEQLSAWLRNYSIGTLTRLEGIAAGIENTNYYVTTTHGRYVLTLFEKLKSSELPFYLELMAHLARHGIPSPQPIANLGNEYLGELNGRPAAIVTCVPGRDLQQVDAGHCATIGGLLAQMHLAGASYRAEMPNPRGARWWRAAMPNVLPFLDARAAALLQEEVRFQALYRGEDLPRGVIHADLFRDNVLWDGERVGGIIDFYFACNDALLYDVAIAVNDWCGTEGGALDRSRTAALLAAYHRVRPFTAIERGAWPVLLRAGALRFWISRLYDLYLPRPGLLTHAKDPREVQRVLEHHVACEAELRSLFVP
ncbi:MAG: homoserine kinase [Betaproteobacteria bacterium]|nr:homoserine kinase [Betaproteobacteria bacterium]MBI3056392.1 homoserine kinase [Betaproteobacteria bacterium]